jgi:hypothetical protein
MTGVAAGRLLDSLDSVLNSNSFLLDYQLDDDASDTASALAEFFPTARFRALLAQADIDRGWKNYAGEADHGVIDARLYVAGANLNVSEMARSDFRNDLLWLLTTTRSPHQRQLPASNAEGIVDAFLQELAAEPDSTPTSGDWRYFQVAPTFLRSSGYAGYPQPESVDDGKAPTYFDGGPFDRCLVMRRGGTLHILLTNGAP